MHKVITERPRWAPGVGKHGRRASLPAEQLPKFEDIKRPHPHRKGFTDLLGPLKRWLHSQLGRSWNDVYSEACAVIKPDSVVRAHIKTHLLEFVERHTFMHRGEACVLDTHRGGGIIPVNGRRYGPSRFYINPETNCLEKIPRRSLRERRRAENPALHANLRWLGELLALKQFNGLWFACHFKVTPSTGKFMAYDHICGKYVGRGALQRRQGAYLWCVSKRQLSRGELREHGLTNSVRVISVGAQPSTRRLRGVLRIVLQLLMGRRHRII